jgi:DNA-dependent RNA polymerase auxiliary subunit epsilon
VTDLIVVGAGIAGSSVYRAAKAAGLDVLLVSYGQPDSLAALAALRGAYHKGPEIPLFRRSLELLNEWACVVEETATVTSYRHERTIVDSDWYLVDPAKPLVQTDIVAKATEIPGGVELSTGEELKADNVVWATGVRGGVGRVTHGYTMVHDDPEVLEPGVFSSMRVHHLAPYKAVMAGVVDGKVRLGSTSASSELKAREQVQKMLEASFNVGMITTVDGWRLEYGQRIQSETKEHFSGFHRTGYALAPAMAERLVERLALL